MATSAAAFDGGGVVTAAVLNCVVEGAMQMLQGDFASEERSR